MEVDGGVALELRHRHETGLPVRRGVVPRKRLELSRPCGHRYLKPARLPFRHLGIPCGGGGEVDPVRGGVKRVCQVETGFAQAAWWPEAYPTG